MIEKIERLTSITPQEWGLYAFSRDPIGGKVSPAQKEEMTQQANLCGQEEAKKLRRTYPNQSVFEIAASLGLTITKEDSFGVDNYITFAQFHSPNKIVLFMGNVNACEELIKREGLEELLEHQDVASLLVAHELFHFVEEQNSALYTRTTQIDLWGIGRFRYKSGLICLSELAAMAFAAQLFELSYSPYVFDVVLPWSKNQAQSELLYQNILQQFDK